MQKTKKIILGIAVSLVILLFCFLLLESITRLASPQLVSSEAAKFSPRVYKESDYLPWQLKPGASDTHLSPVGEFEVEVNINSLGLRGEEITIQKPQDTYRILTMGDSFTYGIGVNDWETYSAVLDDDLGEGYQVLNGAYANSYSPDSYYLYLKNQGLQFEPDLVLIGFFVNNDITDLSKNQWEVDDAGLPVRITSTSYRVDENSRLRIGRTSGSLPERLFNKIDYKLSGHSHFWVLLRKSFFNFYYSKINVFNPAAVFQAEYEPEIEQNWETVQLLLLETKQITEQSGAEFGIVILPSFQQVGDEYWAYYEEEFGAEKVDRTKPQELITQFCIENEINCLDLYPTFVEENSNSPLYLAMDSHFNPRGHELVAKQISEHFIKGSS